MFNDLPSIEEIRNDRIREEIKREAPGHCKECVLLDVGEGRGQHGVSVPIPACEKFPDGVPEKFSECIDLPPICRECFSSHECHKLNGEPVLNLQAIQDCPDYQHRKDIAEIEARLFNNIFCGRG